MIPTFYSCWSVAAWIRVCVQLCFAVPCILIR